jgi:hypothetical protein
MRRAPEDPHGPENTDPSPFALLALAVAGHEPDLRTGAYTLAGPVDTIWHVRRRLALALGVLLGLLGCTGVLLHARRWVEVETAHFPILSPLEEAEALELALLVATGSHSPETETELRALLEETAVSGQP